MNKNPVWKYLLLIFIVAPAILFALPNLFENDPGLQVKGSRNAEVDETTLGRVESALNSAAIEAKSVEFNGETIKLRFNDTQTQLAAKKKISDSLGSDFKPALSSISAAPNWLTNLGALPMYLGLDLRGGVHFLIQVDAEPAIERSRKGTIGEIRNLLRTNKLQMQGSPQILSLTEFELKFKNEELRDKAARRISSQFPSLTLIRLEREGLSIIKATMSESEINRIKEASLKKNMEALRNRVDELGVAEPIIQQQ